MTAQASPADLQLLPPELRVVAQTAGLAAALRLVDKRGGVAVYVPHQAHVEHDLVPIITLAGLQALCAAYPGEHRVVPMARAVLCEIRNRRMLAERPEKSVRQLALDYKMHRRRVQQILAEGCGQPGAEHPDLFA